MKFFIILLLITSHLHAESPWGVDADLSLPAVKSIPTSYSSSLLTQFGQAAIKFHQDVISPADGPRSHFIPSSSQYTRDAMHKYGFFQGFVMGCDRLMRENNEDWVYKKTVDSRGRPLKYNPVK